MVEEIQPNSNIPNPSQQPNSQSPQNQKPQPIQNQPTAPVQNQQPQSAQPSTATNPTQAPQYTASTKKSGSKKYLILGIIGVIIIALIAGILLFMFLSPDKNELESSASEEENQSTTTGQNDEESAQTKNPSKCNDIPANLNMQDESYLDSHPEVLENLLCISNAFRDCTPSTINFLNPEITNVFSIKENTGTTCIIEYTSGDKGIQCEYTLEQTKMLYQVAEENNHPELTGFGIVFGMGFEILKYSPGESFETEIINKDTKAKEKIPCKFL